MFGEKRVPNNRSEGQDVIHWRKKQRMKEGDGVALMGQKRKYPHRPAFLIPEGRNIS